MNEKDVYFERSSLHCLEKSDQFQQSLVALLSQSLVTAHHAKQGHVTRDYLPFIAYLSQATQIT